MAQQIMIALGGLGLFLIGMHLLTDGLRALAGDRMRKILRTSTASPARGALAGALTTAVIQSSSATTVATVGFVGAGLMTFQQSLGIIFGANVGTTLTGWVVALVGFKLDLGTALMPVAFIGALMRLFGRGRWRDAGWALAGFSVLFLGIDMLQLGMAVFSDWFTPDRFPADSFWSRLQLLGLGIVATVITQSSSAGVASALAALAAGAISFPQAAALVIGMDVGTTSSALLATVGGSVAARRTGASHVIYNIFTAGMAFALLWPLGWLAEVAMARGRFDPQYWLVGFHSVFNLLGTVLVLGVTARFAAFVVWLVPEGQPSLTEGLDRSLLSQPAAALDTARAATHAIAVEQFGCLDALLQTLPSPASQARLEALRKACTETRSFLENLRAPPDSVIVENQLACLNALDHLDRLRLRCGQSERLETIHQSPELAQAAMGMRAVIAKDWLSDDGAEVEAAADASRRRLRDRRRHYRDEMFALSAAGQVGGHTLGRRLDASRWLQRTAYHVWRIIHHDRVAQCDLPSPQRNAEVAARADADD